MAVSTYQTYLLVGDATNKYKLCDIKDYGDLEGDPETLPTTTLSDSRETSIPGIQTSEGHTFTMNYDKTQYGYLKALADRFKKGNDVGKNLNFYVAFGSSGANKYGSQGGVKYTGTCGIKRSGSGVNEVREMVFTVFENKDADDITSEITNVQDYTGQTLTAF